MADITLWSWWISSRWSSVVLVQWEEAQLQVWEGESCYCGLFPVPHFLKGKWGDEVEEGREDLGEGAFQVDGLIHCADGPPYSLCYTGSHSQDNTHGTVLFHWTVLVPEALLGDSCPFQVCASETAREPCPSYYSVCSRCLRLEFCWVYLVSLHSGEGCRWSWPDWQLVPLLEALHTSQVSTVEEAVEGLAFSEPWG